MPAHAAASPYTSAFFESVDTGARRSARVVAPIVTDLLRPASVVDVGCGQGAWLSAFAESGVADVLGIDGDYVDRSRLLIPPDRFLAADLGQPLSLHRTFDLAVCVEVAEHLAPARARGFIADLTALAPAVLFSAAVPHQGGTHHVNEQWPDYWAALFAERGLACFDALRPRLWGDDRVEWWYRQNLLLFVRRDALPGLPALDPSLATGEPLALVHPEMLVNKIKNPEPRYAARALRRSLRTALGSLLPGRPRP